MGTFGEDQIMPRGRKPKGCYERKNSPFWWYEFEIEGKRFRGSTGVEDAKSAAAFVEAEKTRVRDEMALATSEGAVSKAITIAGRKHITLSDAIDKFEAEKACRYENFKDYQTRGEWLVQIGPDKLLSEITLEDLIQYRMRRGKVPAKGGRKLISGASINREIEYLRTICNYMRDNGFVSPDIRFGKALDKTAEVSRTRELHQEEQDKLLPALRAYAPDIVDVVEFSLLCGQRLRAVIDLKWSDVHLSVPHIEVWLKTRGAVKRQHTVPLTGRMVEIIKRQPAVPGVDHVFTYQPKRRHPKSKKPPLPRRRITETALRKRWTLALEKAGVQNFRWHDMRHTTATRVVRSTGNLKIAQRLLGHTDISTTSRYAHAFDDDVRNALEVVEKSSPDRTPARDGENVIAVQFGGRESPH